jgi:glutathione S-transferase
MTIRLLTLPPSNYSEKARWALDRLGLAYQEECSGPGFHYLALRRVGGKSMPTLVLDSGEVLRDSTDILHHLDGQAPPELRLFPSESPLRQEVEALEDRIDEEMGPTGRDWLFSWVLDDDRTLARIFQERLPPAQQRVFRLGLPLFRQMIRRKMKAGARPRAEHLRRLREALAPYDARLADGRRYLAGDRFTAADLTLAALAAPWLAVPEYGGLMVPLEERPEEARRETEALRATPTGQHVLRIYREHRHRRSR